MDLLKKLLGFFGRTLVGLGLTLFIFSFFMSYALNSTEVFEDSLRESLLKEFEEQVNEIPEEDLKVLEDYCELNPEEESCIVLNNPEKAIDEEGIEEMVGSVNSYNKYIIYFRVFSLILFFIGFGLLYLVNKEFILTLYKVSFSSTITSALSIFYYRFLPALLNRIFGNRQGLGLGDVPDESLHAASDIINTWLYIPLQKTYSLAILITAGFLVLTVVLFFIKKKGLYKIKKAEGI